MVECISDVPGVGGGDGALRMLAKAVMSGAYRGKAVAALLAVVGAVLSGRDVGPKVVVGVGRNALVEVVCREARLAALTGKEKDVTAVAAVLGCGVEVVHLGGAGGMVALAKPAVIGEGVGAGVAASLRLSMTSALYGSFLAAGDAGGVSLVRNCRGEWTLGASTDRTRRVAWSDLPDGKYVVNGGCELVIGKEEFLMYASHVHLFPQMVADETSKASWCYLRVLPPHRRWSTHVELGPTPLSDDLAPYAVVGGYPEAQWVGQRGIIHVQTCGALPPGLTGVRVGGFEPSPVESDGGFSVVKGKRSHLSRAFSKAAGSRGLYNLTAAGRSAPAVPSLPFGHAGSSLPQLPLAASASGVWDHPPALAGGPVPVVDPQPGVTMPGYGSGSVLRVAPRAGLFGSVVGGLSGIGAPTGLGLRDVSSGATRLDVSRFDAGQEVIATWARGLMGFNVYGEWGKRQLGARRAPVDQPPVGAGVGVVVAPVVSPGTARAAQWKRLRTHLPGWNFEEAKLDRRYVMCVAPPAEGVYARYEFHIDGSLVVNGVVEVPGGHSVVWCRGSMTVATAARAGYLWRAWSDSGGCGVDPPLLLIAGNLGDPAVVSEAVVPVGRLHVAAVSAVSAGAVRGTESSTVELGSLPTIVDVAFALPDGWAGKSVHVKLVMMGLQQVKVGGLLVRSYQGAATWVSGALDRPFKVEASVAGKAVAVLTAVVDGAKFADAALGVPAPV